MLALLQQLSILSFFLWYFFVSFWNIIFIDGFLSDYFWYHSPSWLLFLIWFVWLIVTILFLLFLWDLWLRFLTNSGFRLFLVILWDNFQLFFCFFLFFPTLFLLVWGLCFNYFVLFCLGFNIWCWFCLDIKTGSSTLGLAFTHSRE